MLLLLAVLPGVVLFAAVRKQDKIEKEPAGLLWKLFIGGALTTVSAIVLGRLGGEFVTGLVDEDSLAFLLIDNFIITALVEEGGKYFVLKRATWKHPAFNYTFDAIVYAVTASLGFAVLENILYVVDSDLETALLRAVLSVPGHAFDGVYMGYFYGLAKSAQTAGSPRVTRKNLRRALWTPVLLHGFYDFCLETESTVFLIIFFAFDLALTVFAVRRIKTSSRTDAPV
ncbi:MAG: PrsW family intramembrane metalloprotease [Oscillospiraceae bacterium]|nr:PrsW family intramembrane metalloprotease [Oscillospiraceae bacterium]